MIVEAWQYINMSSDKSPPPVPEKNAALNSLFIDQVVKSKRAPPPPPPKHRKSSKPINSVKREVPPPLPKRRNKVDKSNDDISPPLPTRKYVPNQISTEHNHTYIRDPAPPPPRSRKQLQPHFDLEINTCWFSRHDNTHFPRCVQHCDYVSSYGNIGKTQYSIYAFRLPDLSTLVVKFTWDGDQISPLKTLKQKEEFIPPPTATKSQLVSGNHKYAEHIANWCEVKQGSQVGDGECWTLAKEALQKSCGDHAFVSTGLNHGALIKTFNAGYGCIDEPVTDTVKRGDILQFKSCVFKSKHGWQELGHPDHTAIVIYTNGPTLGVIQQNSGDQKVVKKGELNLNEFAKGELRVFRPVDADWIISLSDAANRIL